MALTLLQLRDHALAVLGETHDPRLDVDQIVNEAGRYLFDMHPWKFRERPPVKLSLVEDQEYVPLPSDFGELIAVRATEGLVSAFSLTSFDDLLFKRGVVIQAISGYWGAIVHPGQVDDTSRPAVPRLELWPIPQQNEDDALTVIYRAAWVELTAANKVPNVPARFDNLLLRLVRAHADMYRNPDSRALETIEQSSALHRLKQSDGMVQADYGPLANGAVSSIGTIERLPFGPVSGPI